MRNLILRWVIACAVVGGSLILYIDQLNQLTRLRLEIPHYLSEIKTLQEENERMQYEIDQFESPIYLMELIKKPEFSHLKFPKRNEVIVIETSPSEGKREERK